MTKTKRTKFEKDLVRLYKRLHCQAELPLRPNVNGEAWMDGAAPAGQDRSTDDLTEDVASWQK